MEQTVLNKPRRGRAAKLAALQEEQKKNEEIAVVEAEEIEYTPKRSMRTVGKPSKEERADSDMQKREMRLMAGYILLHFKQAVVQKKLDFNQELQLFKEISKYLGYANDGNKRQEDVGMDTLAMKYVEINARIKNVSGKSAAKS